MRSAAVSHLEGLLQARQLDRTLFRGGPAIAGIPMAASGLPEVDARLGGGWRRGEVSELVGAVSSGRTTVMAASLAASTARGEVAALVDAVDRFDPASAAAFGLDLSRLLWVRGPALTVEAARLTMVERAVQQAVRAFDLIIRAGGFGLVVLDLADVSPRVVRSLPHTTWLRLAHANEGRDTAGLMVLDSPMGRSARGVTLPLQGAPRWAGSSDQSRRLLRVLGA